MLLQLFTLLRPHQYVKNLFVFLPLFFALKLGESALLQKSFFAFCLFCLTASAVYILNDLRDVEEDRLHPTKKFRPIASNAVSKNSAILLFVFLSIIGLGLSFYLQVAFGVILTLYFVVNIAYTFVLKHISIIDITIIAVGFVLRIFAGAVVVDVAASMWIVLITFLLALFLALAKRRDDVLLLNGGQKTRRNIDGYNLLFVNASMAVMAAVVIVSYILYTISPDVQSRLDSKNLYLTVFFVIIGILRYMQLTFVYDSSGSPTKIVLKDRFLQACIFGWMVTFLLILY